MKRLFCTTLLAAVSISLLPAARLFEPDAATLGKIAAAPEMRRLAYRADRTLSIKSVLDLRPDRGERYTLWYLGTNFTGQMESLGYSYMIGGDEKYAKKGASLLSEFCQVFPVDSPKLSGNLECERGQIVYALAIGKIFFGKFLSAEEQALLENTVAGYIDATLKVADDPQTWWYAIHNHNGVMFGPAGIACLLFRDRPGFEKRLAECIRILKRWIELGFDDRGLPCEGSVYARYSAMRVMIFALMLRDSGGEDLFKTTGLGKWPHVYVAKQIPGTNLTDARNDSYYAPPSLECLLVSVANSDPAAEWIFRNWSDGGSEYFPLNYLIGSRARPEPALDFSAAAKSAFFKQRGLAVWRSGWGKDDAMLSIESAPYLTAATRHRSIHAQADRGHFNFYAYGDLWAVDTGYANDANANPVFSRSHTFAHSCVLVDGKGQGRSGNGPGVSGKTLRFEDNAAFGFARTDNTDAYNANNWGEPAAGVRRAVRDAMFLRPSAGVPPCAILFDDIGKDAKIHDFTWQMMLLAEKEVELRPSGALIRNRKPFGSYAMTPARGENGALRWKVRFDRPEKCSFWGLFRAGGISPPDSDSFYLVIDGGEPLQWNTNADGEQFSWQRIATPFELKSSPPKSRMFDFSAGEHTIELRTREKGAQIQALFLGSSPDEAPVPEAHGRFLTAAAAEYSGGMREYPLDASVSDNRCAVYLGAASPVRMELDTFTPANSTRPPSVIRRLRGHVRARNPHFAAVLVPLKSGQPEPEVGFEFAPGGKVTVTIRWPDAVDVIVRDSARALPSFSRSAI